MSTLIVDLSQAWRHARAGLDFVLSQDGASLSRQGNAAPALLPAATELIAVVPPQALSWHVLRLPEGLKLSARSEPNKLRAALVGLMEEQLLAEPDTLHLAVFEHAQPQHLWVAVCDAAALRAALNVLEDAGRVVHRVVPAYSPTASSEVPSLHVVGEDAAQLVLSHSEGVLCLNGSDEAWRLVLNLPIVGASSTPLQIHAEPAAVRQAELKAGRAVTLQTPAQHLLRLMASPFNLAQHNFAQSRRLRGQKLVVQGLHNLWQARAWRPARVGLALLILVNLVGIKLLAWQEQTNLQAKRAQAAQVLQATFPEVTLVVDAPLQMARSMAQLQRGSAVDLSLALQTLAQTLPQAKVSGLVMSATEVRLQGLALDATQTSQLQAAFKAAGMAAQAMGQDWVLGVNAGASSGTSAGISAGTNSGAKP